MIKLLLIFLVSLSSYGQAIDYSQSSSDISWKTISNDFVKLIYPDYLKDDSVYLANLIEHYSKDVGQSYQIERPEQITVIIRPETSQPNGFVTLGPRRSEWFSSSMYSPFLGGLEWYQALSIHEYRHVLQYDYSRKGIIKFLDLALGDSGYSAGLFLGLPSWFFEGDAVWAETKYTDAGRGRSPRFLARLKSLIKGHDIPSYDEFLGGSFNRPLPNHYVYGYILVSSATKRFGDDFWQKVIKYVADFPHPYRIYSGIEKFSGMEFEDFYNETMNELKDEWQGSQKSEDKKYSDIKFPTMIDGELISVVYDLDHYWSLYRGDKKLTEIPFSNDLTRMSFSKKNAVYNQYLPSPRFDYKESSDLILVDLKSAETKKITDGLRLYNPSFNRSGDKILATLFDEENNWSIAEFNLEGERTKKWFFKDLKIAESHYIGDESAVAVVINKIGEKSIVRFDLNSKKTNLETLLPFSRNTIFNLNITKEEDILFEAQKNGVVDIFRFSPSGVLSQCTQASIMATTPSSDGEFLYFSDQVENGSVVGKTLLSNCKEVSVNEIIDYKYLGKNSSDAYNDFKLEKFPNFADLVTQDDDRYKAEDYGHIDSRLFVPHSWNFFGGNGFQLSTQTDNYLRTLSLGATIGEDGSENVNYSEFTLAFKKYYPIFALSAGARNRSLNPIGFSNSLSWEEKSAQLNIVIPYIYSFGLFNFGSQLVLSGGYLDASDYKYNDESIERESSYFYTSSVTASFKLSKSLNARSIQSPLEVGYTVKYDDLDSQKVEAHSSYRLFQNLDVKVPGFFLHDGFKLELQEERHKEDRAAYLISPSTTDPTENIFSRGYGYESFAKYSKASLNYVFTLGYPDYNLWNFAYTKRVVTNLFFDSTRLDLIEREKTLNSLGSEVEFETMFFRLIQLNWGIRYSYRLRDSESVGELYFASDLSF